MKINEFFQKGYYINLDHRVERREEFEKEVARLGLSNFFERHSGVTDMVAANQYQSHEQEYVKHGLCCSKAFHNVFTKMKSDGIDRGLVCEDDMYFLDGGLGTVEAALDQLQDLPEWDMVYFGGLVHDRDAIQVAPNLLKVNKVLTMHAVGYNKKILDTLLTYVPYRDSIYDGWVANRNYITKYLVYPESVIQREGPSDIDVSGKALRRRNWSDSYANLNIRK